MEKPDIFTWQKTGHYYVGLTTEEYKCPSNVIMSAFSKVKMSGF